MYYFFTTDRVKNKELVIIYYPMNKIVIDYRTKLIQDIFFKCKRDTILGIKKEDYKIYKDWYKKKSIEYSL